jgi:hypothetical protein
MSNVILERSPHSCWRKLVSTQHIQKRKKYSNVLHGAAAERGRRTQQNPQVERVCRERQAQESKKRVQYTLKAKRGEKKRTERERGPSQTTTR